MCRMLSPSTLVACMLLSAACGPAVRGPRLYQAPGEQLILADEIAKSGAMNAWEVLSRSSHMSTSTNSRGEPMRMWRRGRSAIYGSETPIVVIDGVESVDIQILSQIRADRIAWMRVLTASASASRFGTDGGAGAVIVQTWGAEREADARPNGTR